MAELSRENDEYSTLYLINAIKRLGMDQEVPDSWVTAMLANPKPEEYSKRYAKRLHDLRKR